MSAVVTARVAWSVRLVDVPAGVSDRFGIDVLEVTRLHRATSSRRVLAPAERELAEDAGAPVAVVWCLKEAAVKANGGRTSPWALDDFTVTDLTAGVRAAQDPLHLLDRALVELVESRLSGTARVTGPGDPGPSFTATWAASDDTVAAVAVATPWTSDHPGTRRRVDPLAEDKEVEA
jgi:phosphopantetheinyl transferase (holo-ACP synthase)